MRSVAFSELAAYLQRADFDLEFPFAVSLPEAFGEPLVCRRRFRLLPGRRLVCGGELAGRRVVVKFFFAPGKERRHWRREYEGLRALQEAGIPTPEILHARAGKSGEPALLILAELVGARTLLETWQQAASAAECRRELAAVVDAIAGHHRAGLLQSDIHWSNFLLADGQVYTIDGDAVETRWAGKELDRARSRNNLALFLAEPYPGIDSHLEALWPAYCRARGWEPEPGELGRIGKESRRQRFAKAEKFVAKAGRDCTAFICRRLPGRMMLIDRAALSPDLEEILAAPDAAMENGEILKAGNSATVARVRQGELDLVIKRYNIKNLRHAVSRAPRPSRALVSWRNAQRLSWWGVRIPKPLAVIEKKLGGLRSTAWYLSQYVAGRPALELLPELPLESAELAGWLEQFAGLLQRLRELRLSHGDFKASNFLCGADGCLYLLDLDAMRSWSDASTGFRRALERDYRRLEANWREHPGLAAAFARLLALENRRE
jgi:tRNA A-37 threonylcarbamoyl transferase component Bud32